MTSEKLQTENAENNNEFIRQNFAQNIVANHFSLKYSKLGAFYILRKMK